MSTLRWIHSSGGPLILLPEALCDSWRGVDPSESGESDYARACEVNDIAEVLAVGAGEGLVLGDEPAATTWWPLSSVASGLLVRWIAADSDAAVHRALTQVSPALFTRPGPTITFASSRLLLFEAAFPGADRGGDELAISVRPGVYRVDSSEYSPDAQTLLLLHRLSPASAL